MRSEIILNPSHSMNMPEFRPMPTTPKAMRHFEKKGSAAKAFSNRLTPAENGESPLCPRHYRGIKSRPPTTPKAMRHIENNEGRFFGSESILNPSHSMNMREFRPMPTTPRAMKHFEKKGSAAKAFSNRLTPAENGESPPCPRHCRGIKSRPPDTLSAMRDTLRRKRAVFSGAKSFSTRLIPRTCESSAPCPPRPKP